MADYHFSHSDGKSVWSHCVVTTHVVSEGYWFALDYRSYFRDSYCSENGLAFKSKNDLAIELINGYESPSDEQVYVLVDSWYTSKKLIDACSTNGYHLIGGLRTNRNIYPAGIGIKLSQFISDYVQHHSVLLPQCISKWNFPCQIVCICSFCSYNRIPIFYFSYLS